ncbi:MAG: kinesin [Trebouxia sp. A1-2]|nr:MAG: kinesin [Trebouxia sp. A1-2]
MFGSTGTGKTSLLEGRNGIAIDDDSTKTPGQEGLVQLISASLFDLLEEKQLSTGDKVAARRRLYQARGFEYFVDCTYVELFNESCSDLLRPEGQLVSKLAVVEDPEGWHVAGLRSRLARNSAELAQIFEAGCQARDHGYMDLGSVHDRTAAIFTIRLAQFNPAVDAEDEDAATVSRLHVVDMAGAERLLVDPELLRQREGTQVNQSLLTFATILRKLAQGKPSHSVNQDASVLTKLLSEALGGNCLTTMIGTVRQGEWDRSLATLKHLVAAQQVYNYPVVNHGRVRGLLQRLRSRLLHLQGERSALQQQLIQLPIEPDDSQAPLRNRIRSLQAQLADSRQEQKKQAADKAALQARLQAANDKSAAQDVEKGKLQASTEELIKSEEERLTVSQALLTMQLDLNKAQNQAGQLERAAALEGDLPAQQREADSLRSQLLEQQQANDHLQREATLSHIQLEESREAFRIRIQHCMLEAGDLQKACAIARDDPSSDLVPTQADFQERVQSLAAQLLQVQAQKDADAAHQIKELHARHAGLRHSLKALHAAYAQLRMRLEDVGQRGIHEDEVMGVSLDAALAKEEAAEQDVVSQLRLRAASLERDLLQRSWDGLAPSSKAVNRVMRRVTSEKEYKPLASVDHHKLQALDAENRRAQQLVYIPKAACQHVLSTTHPHLHTLHFCL